ncbi:MAG TPA: phospho-sugar mutase [Gemmataceae bacterium]|nr:phospho-sugar mutase [Gemmataceae bacterium]
MRGHSMELLDQVKDGFRTIEVDETTKTQALKHLQQWLSDSDFAAYRPQLEWLIGGKQWSGLLDRFYQILPFGTGGRRGAVGIGPNRMNPWTLGASVQGHCEYLKERFPGVQPLRVVVAYDVRRFEDKRHNYNPALPNPVLHLSSKDFAQYAAGVYVANGIDAFLLPADSKRYLATPELSFTIRHLNAHGGLNISASHNPPDDNGGKFYDERGGQPVPPDDQIMADLVDQVTTIKHLAWSDAQRSGRILLLDDGPHQAYLDLIRRQSLIAPPRFDEIQIVFTPLHGVGAMTAMEALLEQGFRIIPVEEQMTPDGQFPNVTKTPNPEVPDSMDRAAATARQNHADLVLATDPDADRLGAMIPKPAAGEWRFVTGNELAALLTHFKLHKLTQQGRLPRSPIVITTEITTRLITRIARHFNAQVVNNLLVGFKYMADVLWHLEQEGAFEDVRGTPEDFVIASEESHGILVTPAIRDKDSAGAALLMAELALEQKRLGRTVLDYLEALYRQFGYFRNEGVSVVLPGILGKQNMARMLDALRVAPPKEIGGLAVTAWEDLRDERSHFGPIKGATDFASRNFLLYQLGEHARIALRPSGTEPKAKAYIEACSVPCPAGASAADWQRSCREVDELADRLAREFLQKALALIGMTPAEAGLR